MKPLTFIIIMGLLFTSCKTADKKEAGIQLSASNTPVQNMPEDKFWQLIDNSITGSNNSYQVQIVSLKQILAKLSPEEIVQFNNTFYSLMGMAYDNKLWGAAYVINGGCSDDDFLHFREYLIAHGKDKFYQTLKDPESCAPWMKTEGDDNWDGILYSASGAYKIVTNKELPAADQAKYELKGEAFDEDAVDKQYPVLAKKFEDN